MKKAVVLLTVAVVVLLGFSLATNSNVNSALAQSTAEPTVQALPTTYSDPVLGGAATEVWTYTYIAQQDFERGYMFWFSPTKEIWVLTIGDGQIGEWRVYQDTFTDGDPEIDTSLTAPTKQLYQPRRGFGKLWRDKSAGLMDALGWATTPEFAVSTPISYLTANNAPGRYLIMTMGRQLLTLQEKTPGKPGGTWRFAGVLFEGNFQSPPQLPSEGGPEATAEATAAQ
jgi:hypothetical protein